MRTKKIEVKGTEYEVSYADNLLDHALGMRGRKEGKILFEFPLEKRWTLDMALVLTDLHLYFFDSEGELVETGEIGSGGLNPFNWKMYKAGSPYRYLLESSEPMGLAKGEKLEIG